METPINEMVDFLRRAVLRQADDGLTDGQLLVRLIEQRDQTAVTALVQRHGSMVWGVCRRILRNHHDAEDAFQATFLVLVRKAVSIRQSIRSMLPTSRNTWAASSRTAGSRGWSRRNNSLNASASAATLRR